MEQEDVPYNDKNVLIGESDINKILKTYGIKMKCFNVDIYRKALVHKSYTTRKNENFVTGNVNCPENCLPLQEECNERFEYLGDSVLSTSVANYLYKRFPNENEGALSKRLSELVSKQTLLEVSNEISIKEMLKIDQVEKKKY